MKYTVDRCMKRPGLIDRARTYYLEFNEKGLYVIAIGKAGQKPYIPREMLVTVAAQALAKPIINKIEEKMEAEIVANEQRLASGQLESMAQEKHSRFLEKGQISQFKLNKQVDTLQLVIKASGFSITLYAHEAYAEQLQQMEQALR